MVKVCSVPTTAVDCYKQWFFSVAAVKGMLLPEETFSCGREFSLLKLNLFQRNKWNDFLLFISAANMKCVTSKESKPNWTDEGQPFASSLHTRKMSFPQVYKMYNRLLRLNS